MATTEHLANGDVSCRVTAYLIQQRARLGLPNERVADGTDLTLDQLQSAGAFIPWDSYLVFLQNVHCDLSPEQFIQLCTSYNISPFLRPLLTAAGLWRHPARHIEWVADPNGGALQQLFRCLETRWERIGDYEVLVEERIHPGYSAPPDVFWKTQVIGFEVLSSYFGLAPSVVTWEAIESGARFHIRLPKVRRFRRILTVVTSWFQRESAADVRAALLHGHERSLRLEQEIAARKRAEHALHQSESRLQRITDAIPGIVYQYSLDIDGRQGFTFVSGGAGDMCGYSPDELVQDPQLMWRLVLPEYLSKFQESIARSAVDHRPWLEEFQIRKRDGEVRWIRGESSPQPPDGSGRLLWNGILTDITAERNAAETLAARERQLSEIAANLPGVLFQFALECNGTFHVAYLSDGVRSLLGYAVEELTRRDPFELLAAEQRESAWRRMLESAESLCDWAFEAPVRRADGKTVWLRVRATASRGANGETFWNGVALDVSDQKRAEEEARIHAARVEALATNSDAFIQEIDRDGVIRYANRAAAGRTPSDLVGRRLVDFLQETDRNRVAENLETVFRTGVPSHGEFFVADGHGELRAYSAVLALVPGAGQAEHIVLTAHDVSDRLRAEEAVRRSEVRFRRLIEKGNEVVSLYDANGVILYESPAAEQVKGFTPEELVGTSAIDLIHPDDLAIAHATLGRILERPGASERVEIRCRCKDGFYRWLDFVATNLLHDPAIGAIVGNYRDITAWREANDKVRANAELLRKLSEQVPGVIYQFRQWPDGRQGLPYASDGLLEVFEVAPDDVRESADAVLARLHPDDSQAVIASINRSVETMEDWRCEYRVCLPTRGVRWLEGHSVPERLADGSTLWHGYIVDVTDRKLAENALRRSEESLRAFVDTARDVVFTVLPDTTFALLNPQFSILTGWTLADWLGKSFEGLIHPDDLPLAFEMFHQAVRGEPLPVFELRVKKADGGEMPIELNVTSRREGGAVTEILGIGRDVSERNAAEQRQLEHVQFLEILDKVNRAIQGAPDVEQMMRESLQAILDVFGCDRAWLVYPCDPESPTWRAAMECTRPEYPGAFAIGAPVQMDPSVAETIRLILRSESPACFGSRNEHPLAPLLRDGFSVQSQMAIAVWPRVDKPYAFGVHQCSGVRVWTSQEQRLFQEISRRFADALTTRLIYRRMQDSEARFRTFVDHATDAFFLHDSSGVILDVNRQACISLGYARDELIGKPPSAFDDEVRPETLAQFHSRLSAGEVIIFDTRHRRKEGACFPVEVRIRPFWEGEQRYAVSLARDITERKQAELRQARLATIFEESLNEIYVFDGTSFRFLEANRAARSNTGYSMAELVHMTPLEIKPAFTRDEFVSFVGPLRSGQVEKLQFEAVHRRKDGTTYPVEVNLQAGAYGEHAVFVALIMDITERKRAQNAIQEAEYRQRLALDAGRMGTWDWDIARDVVVWDAREQELFGFTPGEYDGRPSTFFTRLHPDDVPSVATALSDSVATGKDYEMEFRAYPRPGELRWMAGRGQVIRDEDGRSVRLIGINYDLTDRKSALLALEEASRRQRLALDAGRMGTWDWEIGSDRLEWDDREAALFGFAPGEFDSRLSTFLSRVHPDDVGLVRQVLADSATGKDFDGEFRIILPSGEVRWIHGTGGVRPATSESAARLIGINYDITDRVQTEEKLRASLREKEALLKEIHHRVKNNLQVINSLLNLQVERIADPSARAAFLESKSRVRAMALVHETLYGSESLARIELPRYIDRLCDSLLQTFGGADRIMVERAVAPMALDLDRALPAGLIVSELVSNALKYAFPNGRRGRILVSIDASEEPGYNLCVSDDGVGLPPEVDLEQTPSLGLYLVRVLVKQLRGALEVTRVGGLGFTVRFPA